MEEGESGEWGVRGRAAPSFFCPAPSPPYTRGVVKRFTTKVTTTLSPSFPPTVGPRPSSRPVRPPEGLLRTLTPPVKYVLEREVGLLHLHEAG